VSDDCVLERRSMYINPASSSRRPSERRAAVGAVEPDTKRPVNAASVCRTVMSVDRPALS